MTRKVLTVVGVVVLGLAGATLAWAATGGTSKAQQQVALRAAAANTAEDAIAGTITINGEGFTSIFAIEGYSHEIVSPRDPASGLPTGKRQHHPLVITKELDKATPLLMQALFQNRTLKSLTVNLLDEKTRKPEATVTLTNAQVASNTQRGPRQTVSFTYQKITWTWIDGGITAEDDWEAPVS